MSDPTPDSERNIDVTGAMFVVMTISQWNKLQLRRFKLISEILSLDAQKQDIILESRNIVKQLIQDQQKNVIHLIGYLNTQIVSFNKEIFDANFQMMEHILNGIEDTASLQELQNSLRRLEEQIAQYKSELNLLTISPNILLLSDDRSTLVTQIISKNLLKRKDEN